MDESIEEKLRVCRLLKLDRRASDWLLSVSIAYKKTGYLSLDQKISLDNFYRHTKRKSNRRRTSLEMNHSVSNQFNS